MPMFKKNDNNSIFLALVVITLLLCKVWYGNISTISEEERTTVMIALISIGFVLYTHLERGSGK